MNMHNSGTKIEVNRVIDFFADPISEFLFTRNGINNFLLIYLLLWGSLTVSSIVEGSFFDIAIAKELSLPYIPMIGDYGLIAGFIFYLITSYFALKFFHSLYKNLIKLWDEGVFTDDVNDDRYKDYLETHNLSNDLRMYYIGSFCVIIYLFYEIILTPDISDMILCVNRHYFPYTYFFYLLVNSFISFLVGILMWKIFSAVNLIRSVCGSKNDKLTLRPLNHANVWCLYPIGDITLSLSRIFVCASIVPIGSFLYGFIIYPTLDYLFIPRGILQLFLYVIITTILFIFPLLSTRTYIKKEKEELIKTWREKYRLTYSGLYEQNRLKLNGKNLDSLIDVYRNYENALKMSVWPIPTSSVLNFLGNLVFPMFIMLIEFLVSIYIF